MVLHRAGGSVAAGACISVFAAIGAQAEQRMIQQLGNDLASARVAGRSCGITRIAGAELGARLLIA